MKLSFLHLARKIVTSSRINESWIVRSTFVEASPSLSISSFLSQLVIIICEKFGAASHSSHSVFIRNNTVSEVLSHLPLSFSLSHQTCSSSLGLSPLATAALLGSFFLLPSQSLPGGTPCKGPAMAGATEDMSRKPHRVGKKKEAAARDYANTAEPTILREGEADILIHGNDVFYNKAQVSLKYEYFKALIRGI